MGVLASTLPIDQKGTPALYSDTLANRPAAGFTGRLFVSTDTFALYRDNGTTWDLIGGPGTGTITGTIQDTQVAFGTAANEIGGNANFIYNAATGLLSVSATNNDSVVRFTQNNPVGYLLALNDGTNDVVIADRFGTIYASAFAAFLTFANVYAGGFINDDALGKGLQVQGGSTTTQSLLVTNFDDTITMLELFQNRLLIGVSTTINNNQLIQDGTRPVFTQRLSGVAKLLHGIADGNNDLISGTVAGDVCFRAQNQKILLSTDSGTTAAMLIDTAGFVGINQASPQFELDVFGTINSLRTIAGGISLQVSQHNENFNINPNTANVTLVHTDASNYTWTLELASGNFNVYNCFSRGSGTVTIQTSGSDVIIDQTGAAVVSVTITNGQCKTLQSDGSSRWLLISSNQ